MDVPSYEGKHFITKFIMRTAKGTLYRVLYFPTDTISLLLRTNWTGKHVSYSSISLSTRWDCKKIYLNMDNSTLSPAGFRPSLWGNLIHTQFNAWTTIQITNTIKHTWVTLPGSKIMRHIQAHRSGGSLMNLFTAPTAEDRGRDLTAELFRIYA